MAEYDPTVNSHLIYLSLTPDARTGDEIQVEILPKPVDTGNEEGTGESI